MSCIPIPTSASTPFILGKSRMRKRARTDLCGGRSVMVVPTATVILTAGVIGSFRKNREAWVPARESVSNPYFVRGSSARLLTLAVDTPCRLPPLD